MNPSPWKLPGVLCHFVLGLGLVARLGAALSLSPAGTGLYTFEAVPSPTEWSTASIGVGSDTVRSASDLDTAVQVVEASSVNLALTVSATTPPSQNALARWNSTDHYLQTKPAGNAFTVLMLTLRNDTGVPVDVLTVSYDFGRDSRLLFADEPMPGYRAYFSLTGLPSNWEKIPEFSTAAPGSLTAQLVLGAWAPGTLLFLLWADDNATTETDSGYTIDNFVATIPRRTGVISVLGNGTGTNQFDQYPDVTNGWSTFSLPGSANNIVTEAQLTAEVQQLQATNLNEALWKEYTWPPDNDGGNAIASYNFTGQFLQTRPVGNKAILLMATLQNDSGSNLAALTLSYDFAVASSNVTENIEGHRAYYSLSGQAGDWRVIPELSATTSGPVRATIELGSWPNATLLHILWADDNGPSPTLMGDHREGAYTIDNFAATPAPAIPRVFITQKFPQYVEIAWPWSAAGYEPQSIMDLAAPDQQPVVGTTYSASGFHRVIRPARNGMEYFRLIKN